MYLQLYFMYREYQILFWLS